MKRIFTAILLVLAMGSAISCGAAYHQTKEEKAQEAALLAADIDKAVKSKVFAIDITRIFPMAYPSRETMNEYQIQFNGNKVSCRLPYMGNSHTASFGDDDISIVLDRQQVNYTDDFSDAGKGEYRFFFQAVSGHNSWKFTVQIYDNGIAYIGCDCNNKDNIRYSGEVNFKINNDKE